MRLWRNLFCILKTEISPFSEKVKTTERVKCDISRRFRHKSFSTLILTFLPLRANTTVSDLIEEPQTQRDKSGIYITITCLCSSWDNYAPANKRKNRQKVCTLLSPHSYIHHWKRLRVQSVHFFSSHRNTLCDSSRGSILSPWMPRRAASENWIGNDSKYSRNTQKGLTKRVESHTNIRRRGIDRRSMLHYCWTLISQSTFFL